MSIPEHGYPLAAAVSPRLQVIDHTASTNADVVRAVMTTPDDWPHLSVLLTTDQTHGRGRIDRHWTTPPGSALALSTLVRVPDLPVHARGWIPLIAGAAMAEAVSNQLDGQLIGLKWPNDVLVDGGKICGILAEVVPGHPDAVVIGAGVNTRMTREQYPVPSAISFAAFGITCDDDRLMADYLTWLDKHLADLVAADGDAVAAGVHAAVEKQCTTIGRIVSVQLPGGETLGGRARRLDHDGRLVLWAEGAEVVVGAGDVVHVR